MRQAALVVAAIVAVLITPGSSHAQSAVSPRVSVEVEGGDTGTGFSLLDLTGRGPDPFVRVSGTFQIAERHGVRPRTCP